MFELKKIRLYSQNDAIEKSSITIDFKLRAETVIPNADQQIIIAIWLIQIEKIKF